MSQISTAQEWRAFLRRPGAKALVMDARWLLAGCPTCDCRFWLISGDGYAYCEGCDRGFGFGIGACPISGSGLVCYNHRGSLESSQDAISREDSRLAAAGLTRADFAPARILDVRHIAGGIKVLTFESWPGPDDRQPPAALRRRANFQRRTPDRDCPAHGALYLFSLAGRPRSAGQPPKVP